MQSEIETISSRDKIILEHRLSVQKIIIDRLLIGLILCFVGFLANITIEKFKFSASNTRFFMEKRLEAATKIRESMTDVTTAAFKQTEAPCELTTQQPSVESLSTSSKKTIEKLNSSSLLFSKFYLDESNVIINIFFSASQTQKSISCDSRYFFSEIADYFTALTISEVNNEKLSWSGYIPKKIIHEEMDGMSAEEYFLNNFNDWKSRNKKYLLNSRPIK